MSLEISADFIDSEIGIGWNSEKMENSPGSSHLECESLAGSRVWILHKQGGLPVPPSASPGLVHALVGKRCG